MIPNSLLLTLSNTETASFSSAESDNDAPIPSQTFDLVWQAAGQLGARSGNPLPLGGQSLPTSELTPTLDVEFGAHQTLLRGEFVDRPEPRPAAISYPIAKSVQNPVDITAAINRHSVALSTGIAAPAPAEPIQLNAAAQSAQTIRTPSLTINLRQTTFPDEQVQSIAAVLQASAPKPDAPLDEDVPQDLAQTLPVAARLPSSIANATDRELSDEFASESHRSAVRVPSDVPPLVLKNRQHLNATTPTASPKRQLLPPASTVDARLAEPQSRPEPSVGVRVTDSQISQDKTPPIPTVAQKRIEAPLNQFGTPIDAQLADTDNEKMLPRQQFATDSALKQITSLNARSNSATNTVASATPEIRQSVRVDASPVGPQPTPALGPEVQSRLVDVAQPESQSWQSPSTVATGNRTHIVSPSVAQPSDAYSYSSKDSPSNRADNPLDDLGRRFVEPLNAGSTVSKPRAVADPNGVLPSAGQLKLPPNGIPARADSASAVATQLPIASQARLSVLANSGPLQMSQTTSERVPRAETTTSVADNSMGKSADERVVLTPRPIIPVNEIQSTNQHPKPIIQSPPVLRGTDGARVKSIDSSSGVPAAVAPLAAPTLSTTRLGPTVASEGVVETLNLEDNEFQSQLSERVRFLVNQGVSRASISLRPASLGEVNVNIDYQDEGARVQFQAANAVAREALEHAMPRLREMLDAVGVRLQEANVGTQSEQRGSTGHNHRYEDGDGNARTSQSERDDQSQSPSQSPRSTADSRLIDTYV